ncbi:MAG TPA: Mur ligase family protein [Candidatus Limnocylindrales bacterium]|nr:Mur ligase family protein [Candidatus Limnocylindrales bacterium]
MTRSAADVGAGLAPARPARSIRSAERIHVIGVAGAGASAAALLADAAGAIVSGCDNGGPSPYTPPLEAAAISLEWRHDVGHVTALPRPDRVAVTKALTSIEPDHPELAAARALGIPLQPWQQVVADAAVGRTLVAVAGTHGKSTTGGWLTHALVSAGRDPSAFVGALLPGAITGGLPATARAGGGDAFVVEADEYAGNFDAYHPAVAVVTNVDWDHPDVFADRAAVVAAFAGWLEAAPAATVVINSGDPGAAELLARLGRRPGRVIRASVAAGRRLPGGSVTTGASAAVTNESATGTEASIGLPSGAVIRASLPTAGVHNVANALLVAATAEVLGLNPAEIGLALRSFPGIGRRLERKGEVAGVAVYDDYGHHPTAIRATIAAVRQREPGRRLWIACEPLTFHRTAALREELAAALAEADGVAVADIWPGRDPDRTIASSAGLAAATAGLAPGRPVEATGDVDATADWLAGRVGSGDVVLVMGGGHSYRIADRLLERLRGREAAPGLG